jgi:hypothetical protein
MINETEIAELSSELLTVWRKGRRSKLSDIEEQLVLRCAASLVNERTT